MSAQESYTPIQGTYTLDPNNPKLLDILDEISVSICKIKLLEDIFAQRCVGTPPCIELSKKGYDGLSYTLWSISDTLTHIERAIENLVKGTK